MIAGYHSAGLLLHDPGVALRELAHLGFGCVAIRPHPCSLNLLAKDFSEQVIRLGASAARYDLRIVLDLDAFYFDDPWTLHGPSLVATNQSERERAYDWIARWLEVAAEIRAPLVTFASGAADDESGAPTESALDRLASQLERLLTCIDPDRVHLALRPRSGDAIATVAQFERLGQWLGQESELRLAADVGEMLLAGELPLADRLARNLDSLACVYLCDRKAGINGDQPIGQGDVALFRILRSLREHQFSGPAIIRVEGHSELGLSAAGVAKEMYEQAVPPDDPRGMP